MFKALVFAWIVLTATSVFAVSRTFSLSGTYSYLGDGTKEEEPAKFIMFPGDYRNGTDTGYENAPQPPRPWYAKIPMNTEIKITDFGDHLEVEHTSLVGAYAPSQLGPRIISPIDLNSMSQKEKVEVNNLKKEIVFTSDEQHLTGGLKTSITVQKLDNGDIKVTQWRKGWALLPSPLPVTVTDSYILHAK